MLQTDESRCSHLHGAKDSNNFKNVVIYAGSQKDVILFGASPKIDATHKAEMQSSCYIVEGEWPEGTVNVELPWNVEYHNAL